MMIDELMSKVDKSSVREELISCLTSEPKYLSPMYFYDNNGSKLFEEITRLEEYYIPKVEMPLLRSIIKDIIYDVKDTDFIELGSGDCSKISVLLEEVPKNVRESIVYYPVDVCKEAIEESAEILHIKYPEMKIHGVNADFIEHIEQVPCYRKKFFFFFGSTIGNLTEEKTIEFMNRLSKVMDNNDRVLIGMDLVKDISILEKAYNDSQGVTAEFNKNILNVVNYHLKTDFIVDDFEHVAFFNEHCSRIEMHLMAKRKLEISSPLLDDSIRFEEGEMIHTESSHKFTPDKIDWLAEESGLKVENIFTDEKNWFSLVYMVKI